MADHTESAGMAGSISAHYDRFLNGIQRIRGYTLLEEGETLSLAFEPWFVESGNPFSVPCLRITFRRQGDRIALESFVVEEDDETRNVDLDAAHGALQAWMDSVSE